jgi:hypothetical protein
LRPSTNVLKRQIASPTLRKIYKVIRPVKRSLGASCSNIEKIFLRSI